MARAVSNTPQAALAWCMLAVLMVATLAEGGNQPLAWTLLGAAVFVLFIAQLVIDFLTFRPGPLNRLWLPALLFVLALGWGAIQRVPVLPSELAHPVWALELPERGDIRAELVEFGTSPFTPADLDEDLPTSSPPAQESGTDDSAVDDQFFEDLSLNDPLFAAIQAEIEAELRAEGVLTDDILEFDAPNERIVVFELIQPPPVISADPESGRHVLMRLLTYAMVFWISVRAAMHAPTAWSLISVFAVFSSALAVFGVYAAATGTNVLLGDAGTEVVSASFVNRNNYATFAVFGALANLAVFLRQSRKQEHKRANPILGFVEGFFSGTWLWLLGFMLCTGALLLSQSRAGALAMMVGLLVFIVSYRLRGRFSSVGPIAAIAVIAAAVAITAATGVLDRFMAISDENGRFAIYPQILSGIADRPLLGHGLGAFKDAFRPYVPLQSASGDWDLAHNSYLENAFELGLPAALAFYLALCLVAGRILAGLAARQRGRAALAFAFASCAAAAFHAGLDFSLQMPAVAAVFAWILGVGYAQSFREEEVTASARLSRQRRLDNG